MVMNLDENMSHYEILGISENATIEEIESSYERLMSEIDTDYLALYSMVDESEMDERRHRVQVAYEILRDEGRRARYDEGKARPVDGYPSLTVSERSTTISSAAVSLTVSEQRAEESVTHTGAALSAEVSRTIGQTALSTPVESVEPERAAPSSPRHDGGRRVVLTPEVLNQLTADTEFSGGLLRGLRETAGLSLEDMAAITKISKRYLRAIEGDDFATLPAKVYIRGFVGQYARVLGLDSGRVAQSYLRLVEQGLQEG